MKPKKWKNWKGLLKDSNGVATKLKYDVKNDCFLNYSLIYKKFIRVTTLTELQNKYGGIKNFNALTPVGAMVVAGIEPAVAVDLVAQANHTGNHYRNTSVKVPSSVYGRK